MIFNIKKLALTGVFRLNYLKTLANASVLIFAFSTVQTPLFAKTAIQTPDAGTNIATNIAASSNTSATAIATPKPPWPSRPIKYVVTFPPGGLADSMARIISPALAAALNETITIENRAGGSGMTGYASVVANAAANAAANTASNNASSDGHTWLAITLTHAINQSLFPNQWPPLNTSITPVAVLATSPMVVVVNANVNANTLAELAALAKARATIKPLAAGSSGNGTPPHLGLALLEEAFNADILHIPYKGGSPSILDLLSHQIDIIVANLPEALPHIKSGKLRALAVASFKRSAYLPNVPTTIEAGYPSVIIENWTSLTLPINSPREIVSQLAAAVERVMAAPETKLRLDQLGFTPALMSPEASAQFINAEVNRWGKVVRDKQIKPE